MLKYNILKILGIQGKGWGIYDIKTFKGAIYFYIEEIKKEHICRQCGQVIDKIHDKRTLGLRDWPFGADQVFIIIRYCRIDCECCGYKHRREHFPFQGRYTRLTRRYESFVYYLLKKLMMSVSDVMRLTGLSYSTVYNIDVKGMIEDKAIEPIEEIKALGVDEVSFRKGHKYVTVFSDLERQGVVYVTTGNKKESVETFFKLIGEEAYKKIETVVSDFHKPFLEAFEEYIPKAVLVGDRFHVAKLLNETLDKIRKRILENTDKKKTKSKKKIRDDKKLSQNRMWVLRKRKTDLEEKELLTLEEIKKLNEPLYEAYLLKEEFLNFFAIKIKKDGEKFLAKWIVKAYKTKHEELKDFCDFILRKKEYLLNYFKVNVVMGFCEGINNKIKVIKRMGYGYRNQEVFKMKIRQRCAPIRMDLFPTFYNFADKRLLQFKKMNIQIENLY